MMDNVSCNVCRFSTHNTENKKTGRKKDDKCFRFNNKGSFRPCLNYCACFIYDGIERKRFQPKQIKPIKGQLEIKEVNNG